MITYSGHVRNGVIVLDEPADIPEGTTVVIRLIDESAPSDSTTKNSDTEVKDE